MHTEYLEALFEKSKIEKWVFTTYIYCRESVQELYGEDTDLEKNIQGKWNNKCKHLRQTVPE